MGRRVEWSRVGNGVKADLSSGKMKLGAIAGKYGYESTEALRKACQRNGVDVPKAPRRKLTPTLHKKIAAEAKRRGVTKAELIEHMVAVIAADNMYDAVLDDAS